MTAFKWKHAESYKTHVTSVLHSSAAKRVSQSPLDLVLRENVKTLDPLHQNFPLICIDGDGSTVGKETCP